MVPRTDVRERCHAREETLSAEIIPHPAMLLNDVLQRRYAAGYNRAEYDKENGLNYDPVRYKAELETYSFQGRQAFIFGYNDGFIPMCMPDCC